MTRIAGILPAAVLALLAATPAAAFCIHNDSEQSLFFAVGDHGIEYRKWVPAQAMSCCDWRRTNCNWTHVAWGQLSVRVYDQRPDGVAAACSARVRADGHLRLGAFAAGDRCRWEP